MIKFTVVYPYLEGTRFDHDYYRTRHCTMAHEQMGSLRYEVDRGIGGVVPGSPPPFHAMVHFYFDTLEAFQAGLAAGGKGLGEDIPNYTDVTPVIQVSQVTKG